MPPDVASICLRISVTRSGGFAGLAREWAIAATAEDAPEWMRLVDACPWRSVAVDTESRDRFVYLIAVSAPRKRRSATVPEASLTGPWKDLVDRVRAAQTRSASAQ